jgi:hypothetical protein
MTATAPMVIFIMTAPRCRWVLPDDHASDHRAAGRGLWELCRSHAGSQRKTLNASER